MGGRGQRSHSLKSWTHYVKGQALTQVHDAKTGHEGGSPSALFLRHACGSGLDPASNTEGNFDFFTIFFVHFCYTTFPNSGFSCKRSYVPHCFPNPHRISNVSHRVADLRGAEQVEQDGGIGLCDGRVHGHDPCNLNKILPGTCASELYRS
jgi:hypothetical protein